MVTIIRHENTLSYGGIVVAYRDKNRSIWYTQKAHARRRRIPFLLTFEEWWDIWQQSGHWEERGRKMGQYVMSRPNDKGAYEIGNVRIITTEQNLREANTGNQHRLGVPHTMETKIMMSQNSRGHKKAMTTRQQMSVSLIGNTRNLGRKHSKQARNNMCAARARNRKSTKKAPLPNLEQLYKTHTLNELTLHFGVCRGTVVRRLKQSGLSMTELLEHDIKLFGSQRGV